TSAVGDDIHLETRTNQSRVTISMRGHHKVATGEGSNEGEGDATRVRRRLTEETSRIGERFTVDLSEGEPVRLEKVVWVATDRDWPIEKDDMPTLAGISFDGILAAHRKRWDDLWRIADMRIDGDRFAQRAVRLYIYHLLVTASPDTGAWTLGCRPAASTERRTAATSSGTSSSWRPSSTGTSPTLPGRT
ncbi:MAG: hypothetical protein ACOCYG_01960, partial [Spirochaetota bacterium]